MLRRDFFISANSTIASCEKDYLKLESGKIPAKFKDHVFWRGLGKFLVVLLTILVLILGIAGVAIGVYDSLKVENRVRALYNAAVSTSLVASTEYVKSNASGDEIPAGYIDFVKSNPTLDNFAELVDFSNGKVNDDDLLKSYKQWLFRFGYVNNMSENAYVEVDPTVVADKNGKYAAEPNAIDMIADPVRSAFALVDFDDFFAALPAWVNTRTVLGVLFLIIFIVMVIVESSVNKKKKRARLQKCARLMLQVSKIASDELHDLKNEHRELMTKKDYKLNEFEDMFARVMESGDDDSDW